VLLAAGAGLASSETQATGAQFSAPGLGTSSGVGFNTSVTGGTSTRWALTAAQPLYNPERRAQQRQIELSLGVADLEWELARQNLLLGTTQRYFELALAQETLAVLQGQQVAVQRATTEVQDRFRLGAVPVTDTHEAQARLADVQAQVLLAKSAWQTQRERLAASTGLASPSLSARLPATVAVDDAPGPLEPWLQRAQAHNPGVRLRQAAIEVARQEAAKFSTQASPTVDLVAQASHEHLGGSGAYGSAGNTGRNAFVGLQLQVPLFTGGYRSAKQQEALLLVDKASAEAAQAQQDVEQQVRATWLQLSIGHERLAAATQGLAASTARLDATRLGQQVGHRTTQDLMNAESDLARARLAVAQTRVALVLERLRLAALAGELTEDQLRAVNGQLATQP
jgi:outer membrane protein